jgi:phenylalanyl-tRNA synthetase beta subunit
MQNVEKVYMFDKFIKELQDGKTQTSIAFRIIFQSYEKTLTDADVESEMSKLNAYLLDKAFTVR